MLTLNPKDFSERENYKLLTSSIIPRPVAFVTSIGENGVVNGAPFSYFNIVSSNPPMISLAIQRKNGKIKDTARNINQNKEFVVHIVDEENVKKINETAASLPANESEITHAQLTLANSNIISVPGITEAKIRFECTLNQTIELGDGEKVGTDLLIGDVVQYHIAPSIYKATQIDPKALGAVSRLAGSNYATIGDLFSIVRPK